MNNMSQGLLAGRKGESGVRDRPRLQKEEDIWGMLHRSGGENYGRVLGEEKGSVLKAVIASLILKDIKYNACVC